MKTRLCKIILLLGISVPAIAFSQNSGNTVEKVHLIFKTHLDIGFTQLSSEVEKRYINEFIPKAIAISEQLRSENAAERYVWTTGSWLIWEYLQQATPEAVKKLENAIERNDIVWNGVPYTVESEIMNRTLFETCLKRSQQLDRRYNKKTISAKMTDVPGHTRSIVSSLADAGIVFLHIGVNSASAVPHVPAVCRWQNTDGKEIVLMYQGNYGEDMLLPDGKTIVSINFTNDNHGPHSLEQIKKIYADAKMKYPNATIAATSLNEVAKDLLTMRDKLPVLTSEIGDTWIHGYASSPLRISRYRALSRLFNQWITTGKMEINNPTTIDFAVRLGLIAEHTWGLDIKTFLKNWDKYDWDLFDLARSLPEFKLVEQSWKELDENIDKAIACLPAHLQQEANRELKSLEMVDPIEINSQEHCSDIDEYGIYTLSLNGMKMTAGELTYQTYSSEDYARYQDQYLRHKRDWALKDFGKPGLENSKAKSISITPHVTNCKISPTKEYSLVQCILQFPDTDAIDPRILPQLTCIEYKKPASDNWIEMKVSFKNKPANRLPEAYLLSFVVPEITKVFAEKMGYPVDVSDVVAGGNRHLHAIDNCIDLVTPKGTIRITSLDAPIVVVGDKNMLNFSLDLPELTKGIHFCLFNNLWGTNFSMWFEGSVAYRFKIEAMN